jgi:hypothetical protein
LTWKETVEHGIGNAHAATLSIKAGSSSGAFELFTRLGTGHLCRTSSGPGFSSSNLAAPLKPPLEIRLGEQHRHGVVNLDNKLIRLADNHGAGT